MADPYNYGQYSVHRGNNAQYAMDPNLYSSMDPSQYSGHGEHGDQGYEHEYGAPAPDYHGQQGDQQTITEYSTMSDMLFLNHYCASAHPPRDSSEEAKQAADLSWQPVRQWLETHSTEEVRAATQQRGDSAMTALHLACRNVPPPDIIIRLLRDAIETAEWPDSFGWLPIHYACACGADPDVIKSLADVFPESKTTVDRRGRTPLHFALGNSNPDIPVSPAVVVLLSSTGAASLADDNGMLVRLWVEFRFCTAQCC